MPEALQLPSSSWAPGRPQLVRAPLAPGSLVFPPVVLGSSSRRRRASYPADPPESLEPSAGSGAPASDIAGMGAFHHVPVMRADVLEWFRLLVDGWIIDATCGGAGHAEALLAANPTVRLLGLDRDLDAVRAATERLRPFGARARVVHARFDAIGTVARRELPPGDVVCGVLFDLGVSSVQFDRAERGFSYRGDGPLDMRMDASIGRTAADIVNNDDEQSLTDLLRRNADERFARRIARSIVAARPITTTAVLRDVVTAAIPAPARREGGHPAKRTFQALRIAVNEELDVLAPALDASIDLLTPGGRCVVLAYHSGEDRIVKDRFLLAETGGCTCPVGLPCICGALPRGRRIRRGVTRPSPAELRSNPRATSAVARVFEKAGSGVAGSRNTVTRRANPEERA